MAMNVELLVRSRCLFGGGTAIALALDEYRESMDIDFLCSSRDGYRLLRSALFHNGFRTLFPKTTDVEQLRDIRSDQYSIGTVIGIKGQPIRLEIMRESRIDLEKPTQRILGIPTLTRTDRFCEKLMANADRYADRGSNSRDIIDLSMMMARWGDIPEQAWEKARLAYGDIVDLSFSKAIDMIRDPDWLSKCVAEMGMVPSTAETILGPHGEPEDEPPSSPDIP